MAFNSGQSLSSSIVAASTTFGAVSSAVNYTKNLSTALSSGTLSSNIRSFNLPAAGEVVGDVLSAISLFSDQNNTNDWRVRLSLPNWSSFKTSPVLVPLKEAGGLIFPYTPTVSINSNAKYSAMSTTHTNYAFHSYEASDPGSIVINAPMNVEDPTQALYWIAALHFLRSITKMFAGYDPKAGNPPPVIFLNGYGNYVFKNVPVVVTAFSTTLGKDCDYIGTNVVGAVMGDIQGVTDSLGGLADLVGGAIPSLSGITSTINSITGGVGQVAGLLGTFGVGGTTNGGVAHVPTKSEFQVTLQPMYSRESTRNFSLDRFVQGGYMNNTFGYI